MESVLARYTHQTNEVPPRTAAISRTRGAPVGMMNRTVEGAQIEATFEAELTGEEQEGTGIEIAK